MKGASLRHWVKPQKDIREDIKGFGFVNSPPLLQRKVSFQIYRHQPCLPERGPVSGTPESRRNQIVVESGPIVCPAASLVPGKMLGLLPELAEVSIMLYVDHI